MNKPPICPVSGKVMKPVFSEVILGRHRVSYYFCGESGLLKTERPFWLEEAYQEALSDFDTGIVRRNLNNCAMIEPILHRLFGRRGKFLDIGGGYGLLTRLMRDEGFDCFTTDKYCRNIFAKHFEPCDDFRADALFAFEALEHIENPYEFLEGLFEKYDCRTLIFSTLTFSGDVPGKDWWYYTFDTGQHITFYQPRTLALLASRLGCSYYMIGPDMHIMTDRRLSAMTRLWLLHGPWRKLYALYVRYLRRGMSKTWADHLLMKEKFRSAQSESIRQDR